MERIGGEFDEITLLTVILAISTLRNFNKTQCDRDFVNLTVIPNMQEVNIETNMILMKY
jgi:hypothetical protein